MAILMATVAMVSFYSSNQNGFLGRLGVGLTIFFVISGYVLYKPYAVALTEGEPLGSFRGYYRHRLLRIVPAYWVVLLATFLFPAVGGLVMPTTDFNVAASGSTSVPFWDMFRFATFTQIYWGETSNALMPQAWMLATEMAFFALLPALVMLLARNAPSERSQRIQRQWVAIAAMVGVSLAFRILVVIVGDPLSIQLRWLPNYLDFFALGMALCLLQGSALDDRLAKKWVPEACWALALALLVVVSGFGEIVTHWLYLGVGALIVAPIVLGAATSSPLRQLMQSRPMNYLGRLSYGIYLWMFVAIGRWVSSPDAPSEIAEASRHPGALFQVDFWPMLVWTTVVSVALAAITLYVVERPAMRYRDRPMGWFVGGLWAISIASFISRLWTIATVNSRNPGNGDPFYYHAQANMIADGVGFGEPIRWLTEGRFVASAIHPPLFTLWLTPASLLGARGYLSHKTMAIFAGVAVVVVAALLAKRIAGPRAGLIAAGAMALYPNLVVIDGTLWPEGLYTAMVGVALVAAYRWRQAPTNWGAVLIGASIGAAVLARGEAILMLGFLCLPLVIGAARRGQPWFRSGVLMGVSAVLVIAPWTIRNFVQFEKKVPISTNSDEVLYYANCEDVYSGPLIGYWSFNCQQRERQRRVDQGLPADPPGDESERAAGWGELGREYALSHKDRWPSVAIARITRAWDLQHSETTARVLQYEGRPHNWSVWGYRAMRAMILPAIAGMWVLRRRGVVIWPLVSMLAMVTVTAVAIYGHPRFRTVGDLVLVVCSAVAVDAAISTLRHRLPSRTDPQVEPKPT